MIRKMIPVYLWCILLGIAPKLKAANEAHGGDLVELTLQDIMSTEIVCAAALSKTPRKQLPSTMTTISQEQIQRSGARSLFELLEIFVPSFQYVTDDTQPRHMGLRGIIANRDDKYLLLVNGRIMNEKTDFGAVTERDFPMLADIDHIDVVRGPGSALHGPGALGMVISIVTENADSFEGTDCLVRYGAVEEFQSVEVKHGHRFTNGAGFYAYLGVSEYSGAAQDDASAYFGRTWTVDWDGTGSHTYTPQEPVEEGLARYNQSYQDRPKWKGHLEYTYGGFRVWGRHTSGGEYFTNPYQAEQGMGYNQDTVCASYDHSVNDQLSVTYTISFDQTAIEEPESNQYRSQYAEQELWTKALAQWTPQSNQCLSLGFEWSYERLGLPYKGQALHNNVAIDDSWQTHMISGLGEYKWQITDQWTLFLGGRLDKHSYTDTLCSPRGTLVYTPTEEDTFKLMLTTFGTHQSGILDA